MIAVITRICELFFIFTVFSVGGWIMETLLYLIRDKQAVKRGFLFGPLCPIYGVAAVLCDVVFYSNKLFTQNAFLNSHKILDWILIFIIGFFMSGVLEYFTHFAMEKFFHAMWWDYSGRKFNLNGRIYLNGLLIFGAGVVLIVKLFLPGLYKLLAVIPKPALYISCFIVYSIIIIDVATTIVDLKGAIRTIKNFQATAVEGAQKGVDLTTEQFEHLKENFKNSDAYKKIIKENPVVVRIKKRYPNFKLTNYNKVFYDIFMNEPDESKARKDIKLYGTAESAPKKDEEE